MRANRVFVCSQCAIRFDVGPACPQCRGTREVWDGLEPSARIAAREALLSRGRRSISARLFGRSISVPRVRSWSPADTEPPAIAIGTAQGAERLRSPLARTPCLAWRLYGEGPTGPLDEAGAASFAIEDAEGGPCEIDATVIGVDLEPVTPPALIEADPRVLELLARLFAFPAEGTLRLAEVVLRAGERVQVSGDFERSARADGYRGAIEVRRFVDRPDAPLVVRRAP